MLLKSTSDKPTKSCPFQFPSIAYSVCHQPITNEFYLLGLSSVRVVQNVKIEGKSYSTTSWYAQVLLRFAVFVCGF